MPANQLDTTERYLAADPANPHLLARAIDLSLAAGQLERAQVHVEAALALDPHDAFFQYRKAHLLMARGQWPEAETILAALLAGHPDVEVATSLATCQAQLGQHQAVLATLAPYVDDADLAAAAATLLVRAFHHTGALDRAIALAEKQRARLAGDAAFLAAASLAFLDEGRLDAAAELSSAALMLGARPPEALVVDATLALAGADSARAVRQFKEVLERSPEEGRAWSGLGLASMLARDLPAAAAELEKAVTFLPAHVGSWHALGWCRLLAGDVDGAAAAFDSALILDRNVGETHGGLAVVAALRGDRGGAEASIARALRLDPAGLSARYAQMVLRGETADPERFVAIAMEAMGARSTPFGANLADVLRRHAR